MSVCTPSDMKTRKKPVSTAVILFAAALLVGCGWVDDAGSGPGNELPSIEVLFDDGLPFTVAAVNETEPLLVTSTASDRDGVISTFRWSPSPIAQGNEDDLLALCGVETNFSAELAVESLEQACELEGCQVTFEQREVLSDDGQSVTVSGSLDSADSSSTVQFIATMPQLRAPVALTYSLTASDNQGGSALSEHTFCINSVNDAPVARNDVFTMLESEVLQPALSDRHLLSNDSDDNDIRNNGLSVLVTPVQSPFAAASFELFEDGTFRYEFAGSALTDDVVDRFEYEITDGTSSARAAATIRIVAVNDEPELSEDFPQLIGIVGVRINDDFNQNIVDPEGATLTFSVDDETLPRSGDIELSSDGILSGIPDEDDIGRYTLEAEASDGLNSILFEVPLNIIANALIEARSIPDQDAMVGARFSLLASAFFTDPESQTIEYDIEIDDENEVNLTINEETGLITGFISEAGVYEVTVIADDGVSMATRASFDIDVMSDNEAPEFDGPDIESEVLLRNQLIDPIQLNFSDPDDDDLTYSMIGDLPRGLRLSVQGVITGRPSQVGNYLALRVLAQDDEGLSARSNTFSLFVR